MIINVTYDSSVSSCPQPAAFKACVAGVVNFYESAFTDPITVNISVGWGEVDGQTLPSGAGAASISNYTPQQYTYAQVRQAMISDARSGADSTAVASLGATDPTSGGSFSMTTAEAKALGLISSTTGPDGWVGLDSGSAWTYNVANTNGSNVPFNGLDAFSFIAHEFAEILGRQMNFGSGSGNQIGGEGWYPYDLFDYASKGVRALTNSGLADRYFSIDSGATNTGQHWFNNDGNSGDLFDWVPNGQAGSFLPSGVADSYDYIGSIGIVSNADRALMDVLGYDPAAQRTWLTAVSADFSVAADWSGGVVPTSGAVAALNAGGTTHYTVTASASTTVGSLMTAATATLQVNSGVFTVQYGTGSGFSAGAITILSGATLALQGVFSNYGVVTPQSGATLQIASDGLTLAGPGSINLAGVVKGAAAGAVLANEGRILGSGQLGGGQLVLKNMPTGLIESTGASLLTIDTGSNIPANAGTIEAAGTGGLLVNGGLGNGGKLIAQSSTLEIKGAVTGGGSGSIGSGTLKLDSSFTQNVTFQTGATGALILAQSQGYTGKVSGLSKTGANRLVLSDIAFASGTTKASYSGTTASGVLTVTDGTHTAKIKLVGDYTASTFKLSAASGGGTQVIDPAAAGPAANPLADAARRFISAMSGFGAPDTGLAPWAGDTGRGPAATWIAPPHAHPAIA